MRVYIYVVIIFNHDVYLGEIECIESEHAIVLKKINNYIDNLH